MVDGSRDTERRTPREAADDSMSAAKDIALKDTTRDPERSSFKEGEGAEDFLDEVFPQLRPSRRGQQWSTHQQSDRTAKE